MFLAFGWILLAASTVTLSGSPIPDTVFGVTVDGSPCIDTIVQRVRANSRIQYADFLMTTSPILGARR